MHEACGNTYNKYHSFVSKSTLCLMFKIHILKSNFGYVYLNINNISSKTNLITIL